MDGSLLGGGHDRVGHHRPGRGGHAARRRDFIQKPWENERLLTVLKSQIELRRALREGRRLEEENRVLRSGSTFA